MSDEQTLDYLWNRREDLLYRLALNVLYHQKRERFFELADKLGKAVAVMGGSAAMAKLAQPEVLVWIGAAITASSTLSLVMGFSDKARKHGELARSFKSLQADVLRGGEIDFTEMQVNEWDSRLASIEVGELPALGILVRMCQNEIARARNSGTEKPLRWFDPVLAHFFDLPLAH